MNDEVARHIAGLPATLAEICRVLHPQVDAALPAATCRLWNAMPTWFIGEHPVAALRPTETHVNFVFWSGWESDDPAVRRRNPPRVAAVRIADVSEIDPAVVADWLALALADLPHRATPLNTAAAARKSRG